MNDQSTLDESTPELLRWRMAEDGFWVGTRAGSFAGAVDRNGAHFSAQASESARRTLQGVA